MKRGNLMSDKNEDGMLTDRSTGKTFPLPRPGTRQFEKMSHKEFQRRYNNANTNDRCNDLDSRMHRYIESRNL